MSPTPLKAAAGTRTTTGRTFTMSDVRGPPGCAGELILHDKVQGQWIASCDVTLAELLLFIQAAAAANTLPSLLSAHGRRLRQVVQAKVRASLDATVAAALGNGAPFGAAGRPAAPARASPGDSAAPGGRGAAAGDKNDARPLFPAESGRSPPVPPVGAPEKGDLGRPRPAAAAAPKGFALPPIRSVLPPGSVPRSNSEETLVSSGGSAAGGLARSGSVEDDEVLQAALQLGSLHEAARVCSPPSGSSLASAEISGATAAPASAQAAAVLNWDHLARWVFGTPPEAPLARVTAAPLRPMAVPIVPDAQDRGASIARKAAQSALLRRDEPDTNGHYPVIVAGRVRPAAAPVASPAGVPAATSLPRHPPSTALLNPALPPRTMQLAAPVYLSMAPMHAPPTQYGPPFAVHMYSAPPAVPPGPAAASNRAPGGGVTAGRSMRPGAGAVGPRPPSPKFVVPPVEGRKIKARSVERNIDYNIQNRLYRYRVKHKGSRLSGPWRRTADEARYDLEQWRIQHNLRQPLPDA